MENVYLHTRHKALDIHKEIFWQFIDFFVVVVFFFLGGGGPVLAP